MSTFAFFMLIWFLLGFLPIFYRLLNPKGDITVLGLIGAILLAFVGGPIWFLVVFGNKVVIKGAK